MRKYEDVEVVRKQKKLVHVECDLCKQVGVGETFHATKWSRENYNVDETHIQVKVYQKEGYLFPEGGAGTSYEVDLCPSCFKDRLIPWLISQGAELSPIDWDY